MSASSVGVELESDHSAVVAADGVLRKRESVTSSPPIHGHGMDEPVFGIGALFLDGEVVINALVQHLQNGIGALLVGVLGFRLPDGCRNLRAGTRREWLSRRTAQKDELERFIPVFRGLVAFTAEGDEQARVRRIFLDLLSTVAETLMWMSTMRVSTESRVVVAPHLVQKLGARYGAFAVVPQIFEFRFPLRVNTRCSVPARRAAVLAEVDVQVPGGELYVVAPSSGGSGGAPASMRARASERRTASGM